MRAVAAAGALWGASSLGIAMFDASENSVSFFSQDFWGAADLEWTLQCCFQQLRQPNLILTRWAAFPLAGRVGGKQIVMCARAGVPPLLPWPVDSHPTVSFCVCEYECACAWRVFGVSEKPSC